MKLRDIVNDDKRTIATFSSMIRELVKEIRVTRGDAKGEIYIQVIGRLRSLLCGTTPKIRVGTDGSGGPLPAAQPHMDLYRKITNHLPLRYSARELPSRA